MKIGEGSVVVDPTRPGRYIITPPGKTIDVPSGGSGGRQGLSPGGGGLRGGGATGGGGPGGANLDPEGNRPWERR